MKDDDDDSIVPPDGEDEHLIRLTEEELQLMDTENWDEWVKKAYREIFKDL